MSETAENSPNNPPTAAELAEVIAEFEQYRERLLNETMTVAKKAKISKKVVMAKIEPELTKIDTALQQLREQQVALNANN